MGVTLDELETVIGSHYNPKPMETVQRCLFNVRVRKTGETVTQFITELKKLAEHCKFGDDLPQLMLQDHLICGINNECWQKRLLTEVNPDFKTVYGIALSLEAAEKGVLELQGANSVNKIFTNTTSRESQ